jgi:hypothetical protein
MRPANETNQNPIVRLRRGPDLIDHIEKFRRSDNNARMWFDQLIGAGCEKCRLFSLLTIAAHAECTAQDSIWELLKISRPEFRKLPMRLEQVAMEIEASTRALDIYYRSYASELKNTQGLRDSKRDDGARMVRALARMLRHLAHDARNAESLISGMAGPKRWDTRRQGVLLLIDYVQSVTGKPHWDTISGLLTFAMETYVDVPSSIPRNIRGMSAAQKRRDSSGSPSTFSSVDPDALKQLWRRNSTALRLGRHARPLSGSRRPL